MLVLLLLPALLSYLLSAFRKFLAHAKVSNSENSLLTILEERLVPTARESHDLAA